MSWTIYQIEDVGRSTPNLWLASQQTLYLLHGIWESEVLSFDNSKSRIISQCKLVYFCSGVSLCIPKQNEGEERKYGKDNVFQISIITFAWTTSHGLVVGVQFPIHRTITQALPTTKALADVVKKQEGV